MLAQLKTRTSTLPVPKQQRLLAQVSIIGKRVAVCNWIVSQCFAIEKK